MQEGLTLKDNSIRAAGEATFSAIVAAGLAVTMDPVNGRRLDLGQETLDPATRALLKAPLSESQIEQVLLNRKINDVAFRLTILSP